MNEMNFGNIPEEINENAPQDTQYIDPQAEEIKREPTFSELFDNELVNGLHSVLYKRINNVSISDVRLKEAFSRFLSAVDCGETISVAEIIYTAEAVLNGKMPDDHCENRIYAFDLPSGASVRGLSKLMANSVSGFYALPNLHNGFALDLSAFGGDIKGLEAKRFIVASEKNMRKLVTEASKMGIYCISVGSMLASEQIVLTNYGETIAVFNKEKINSSDEKMSVSLGANEFSEYLNGYCSAVSYLLCDQIAPNNMLHFSLDGSIDKVFARALGYFDAVTSFKKPITNLVYSSITSSVVAVPRPFITEGSYLYLLKVRNDTNGMPEKAHLDQLCYYISDRKRLGIIKDALPLRENVLALIEGLGREGLHYVSLAEIPEDCFGIIVSTNRGDSLNGVRLGYFTNIE
ncbi:MAG: hypothetical protein IJO64_07600 [Clostridia bacterium]|nr:hypothetical protein [Clostridia bacterium]